MNDILELFRIYGTIELEGADKANKDLDRVDGKAKGITGGIKNFAKGVGKVAAGIGVFALVGKAIDTVKQSMDGAIARYDTLNNFPRVMQQLGFDATDSDKSIKRLSDGIQGLPTRLDEVASTAQNIAIMTKDLDGATSTTLALNNAFLASGATTRDAERGLQQYVQMLSKGEVDLQSWRTLQETMGLGLNQLAEDFGYTGASAQNDLYDALKDGKITFDEFNAALIDASERTGGFAEMALTSSGGLKTAFTNMKTWIVMGVADVIAAFDDILGGTGSIEKGILKLKPIIQGVFGWIANTAIPAVANAVGWVRDRFNDLKPTFETVKGALEPLFAVFKETQETMRGQLTPILESLKTLFFSLLPILEMLAAVIGGVLVTALVIWTTIMNGAYRAIGPLINAVISLADFIVNVVNTVIALLMGDFTGALDYWTAATEASIEFFKNLWDAVVGFVMGIVESVIAWFEVLYNTLVGNSIIPDLVNGIIKWFKNLFKWAIDLVKNIVTGIVQGFQDMYNRVSSVMKMVNTIISSILNYVKNTFKNALMFLKGLVTGDFGMMRQAVQNQMQNIRNLITNIVNALPNTFKNGLAKVRSALSNGMNSALKVVTGMASRFLQAGRNIVTSIADGIKGAIGAVTGAIGNVASKIRGFLPFSPADEGPLSDLDKLDFEGPIGDSIERGERTLRAKMAEMLGNVHPTANFNVGGRALSINTNKENSNAKNGASVVVNFHPQSMSDEEMDNAFNYLNRRFGMEL